MKGGKSTLNKLSGKHKTGNKGFSLIELVVCVALLAIVVVPLMQAFTRSTDYYSSSKEKGEATATAQNLREAIEAFSVDDILASNSDFVYMTGAKEFETDGSDALVRGMKSGSGVYDARIHFDADSSDLVRSINSQEIAKYSKLNSSFNQPADHNPDISSSNTYKAKNNITEDTLRRRVILIDLRTSEDSETGEVTVSTTVTFQYHYHADCQVYQRNRDAFYGVVDNCLNQKYELDDAVISSYDEEFTFRLLYYPFFENPGARDTIISFVDIQNTNADKQLKYNLILVKMTPMIRQGSTWKTVTPLEAATTQVPYSGYNSSTPTFAVADQSYALNLYECHPTYYNNISYHCDSAGNWINTTFTNAKKRIFSEGAENNFSLNIRRISNIKFNAQGDINNFTPSTVSIPQAWNTDNIDSHGAIIKTEADTRMYAVTIDIYRKDKLDDDDNLLFHLNTSKLN